MGGQVRRVDWLVVLVCLVGSFCSGMVAYHKGVVAGRQESERLYAAHVRELNRIMDHTEIKKMLSEGQP